MNRVAVLPGELMIIGFDGTEITDDLSRWITERHVGGVVLFSRNLGSMGQVCKLTSDLQRLRAKVSSQPLFIAIDQEGGVVSRMVQGMTVLPGNMALGSIGTEDCAYAAGRITAVEMGLMGFNINFAPVLDVSSEAQNLIVGVRSFGADPALVGRMGAAMIEGLQSNGMLAVAKHFPGLGRCRVDPHMDLPVVLSDEKIVSSEDVAPYAEAIAAGLRMVMTAHAVFRCWEKSGVVPATLSRTILQDVLRKRLGFHGVIVSDDVEMDALAKYFSPEEIVRRGVEAGIDIFTVCHSPGRQEQIFVALQNLLEASGILANHLRKSLSRVQEIKHDIATPKTPSGQITLATLGIHRELVERMGRDSITVVKDEAGLVPIVLDKAQKILLLAPSYQAQTQVEEANAGEGEGPLLLCLFREFHGNTKMLQFAVSPSPEDFALLSRCGGYDLIVLLTYNAHLFPRQMDFARQLLEKQKKVIVVAIRNPYDLMRLPQAKTALATYGFRDCSMRGLVQILFGEIVAHAKLPVSFEA